MPEKTPPRVEIFRPIKPSNKPLSANEQQRIRKTINQLIIEFLKEISRKPETFTETIKTALTNWLKHRYGDEINLNGSDILDKATAVEFLKDSFKVFTNFEILGEQTWFSFDKGGKLLGTNTKSPEEEQSELHKIYLDKDIIKKIDEKSKAVMEMISYDPSIKSVIFPENTLKITRIKNSNGTIMFYVILANSIIIKTTQDEEQKINIAFTLNGDIAQLFPKQSPQKNLL